MAYGCESFLAPISLRFTNTKEINMGHKMKFASVRNARNAAARARRAANTSKNKIRRLKRHVLNNINDECAEKALEVA